MELRHLRYFVSVADELHFGRAAERLGVSQPPLSQQIRALEEELGLTLFERTSRKVRLTEAGVIFLVEARRTLEQADRALDVARRVRHGEMGELRIGFTPSAPFIEPIANALFAFRKQRPSVHLRLDEMPRDTQLSLLGDDQLDIGFIRSNAPPHLPPSLAASALVEEDMIAAMRADHPLAQAGGKVAIADLAAEPFLLYAPSLAAGFNDTLFALFRNAGVEPEIAQEASSPTTLLGLVAAGFGVTVVARSLSVLHLDNVAYREIDCASAVSRLWLVRHRSMSPAGALLVSLIEANVVAASPATPFTSAGSA